MRARTGIYRYSLVWCLSVLLAGALFVFVSPGLAEDVPSEVVPVANALEQSPWMELQDGLSVKRVLAPRGMVVTAYRIDPDHFTFSIALQNDEEGSTAKDVGEREGAVLAANAGFFAVNTSGELYPVGYLRIADAVLSRGWKDAGGMVSFLPDGLALSPTTQGIPKGKYDVFQTRPMLIEPGGIWAMGSNQGPAKRRTLLCTLLDGSVVLATISRGGLTLFEAGWLMRGRNMGGHFECNAAIALDGGSSTQLWHSGEPQYSHSGLDAVHNFLIVRQREN